MNLREAIKKAANIAYVDNSDQIVGRINGSWCIAHNEDLSRQSEMSEPKFLVHADGVDSRHIQAGEITEDWEISRD